MKLFCATALLASCANAAPLALHEICRLGRDCYIKTKPYDDAHTGDVVQYVDRTRSCTGVDEGIVGSSTSVVIQDDHAMFIFPVASSVSVFQYQLCLCNAVTSDCRENASFTYPVGTMIVAPRIQFRSPWGRIIWAKPPTLTLKLKDGHQYKTADEKNRAVVINGDKCHATKPESIASDYVQVKHSDYLTMTFAEKTWPGMHVICWCPHCGDDPKPEEMTVLLARVKLINSKPGKPPHGHPKPPHDKPVNGCGGGKPGVDDKPGVALPDPAPVDPVDGSVSKKESAPSLPTQTPGSGGTGCQDSAVAEGAEADESLAAPLGAIPLVAALLLYTVMKQLL